MLCLNRQTGKILWEQVAKVATPHEGYHRRYGSFASNSPVTDGKHLYAFFGSRGLYKYDLNGKLIWEKQFPPMRMRLQFGEGSATVLDGDTLYLKFDQEEGSYMVALDNAHREGDLARYPRRSQLLVCAPGGYAQRSQAGGGQRLEQGALL